MKNKICIITASRSEYGLLRWLIEDIKDDPLLELQLIVTGGHLSFEQGYTYTEIEKDGYRIDDKIEMLLSSNTQSGIVKSMGLCSISIADSLNRLKPDLLVVLGDRYELLPICSAALIMGIKIAHISGGDITLGAIDDQIRNAITIMASIHFPGTKDSAERIKRITGTSQNIYNVGEPGLDNFVRLKLLSREELASNLDIDISKKWLLFTYHPETRISIESNLKIVKHAIDEILSFKDIQLVITKANTDYGGVQINECLDKLSTDQNIKIFKSLGQKRYLSFMREAFCIIGNSSSGIVEAPFLGIPVINIGNRQKGRHLCENIISISGGKGTIHNTLKNILENPTIFASDCFYGDCNTSYRIKEHIKKFMNI